MFKKLLVLSVFIAGVAFLLQKAGVFRLLPNAFEPLDPDANLYWDWSKIDEEDLHFPKDFLWGTATAAHQIEGYNTNNNWYEFENRTPSPIKNGDKSGIASDHWNRYKEDTDLMKNELGVNSYRFSVEWSKIEPEEGKFSQEAIQHYHDEIDYLRQQGIEPMITLHHFTSPLWFEKLGGWQIQDNIKYFVRFSNRVFAEYHTKVSKWCTINEPICVSLFGYMVGNFPPGKQNTTAAAYVLKHLIDGHAAVYKSFKQTIKEQKLEKENHIIGIVLNIVQFEPYRRDNYLDRTIATTTHKLYTDSILNYLKEGKFRFVMPEVEVNEEDKNVVGTLDYIGVNYYFHMHAAFAINVTAPIEFKRKPEEDRFGYNDMGFIIYPEGIYRAIKTCSTLGVPLIVTENGICDDKDDRRENFIRKYLYAISKAIRDGYDVRGYYYWSLLDNFEWAEGFHPRFGLYHVDYKTQKRTLYNGSKYFVKVVKRFATPRISASGQA